MFGNKQKAYKDVQVATRPSQKPHNIPFRNLQEGDFKKDKVHNFKTGKKENATFYRGNLRFDK